MKCVLGLTFLLVATVSASGHFGYSQAEQAEWAEDEHGSCDGTSQSPVAIVTADAVPLVTPSIKFTGYDKNLPGPLSIQNNGHSVTVVIPKPGPTDAVQMPYITGGPLVGKYILEGLHWHWGEVSQRGSEHTLDGVRYPMELHIIHRNEKYADQAEALNHKDGLSVLGFFYEISAEDSPGLARIARHLENVEIAGTAAGLNTTLKMKSLITGSTEKFFTYSGSLTTPPCSEAVTWIVFAEKLPVSVSQMTEFRDLYGSDGDGNHLVDNFRNLQPLGDRKVYLRNRSYQFGDILKNLFTGVANVIDNLL